MLSSCAPGRLAGVLLVSIFQLHAGAAADDPVATAPPVLVTTEGKDNGWEDVEALAAAAARGDSRAAFEYARLLEAGDQVPRDETAALRFYQAAADAGHADALFRLGKVHHDGLLGTEVDFPKAFQLYRRAAIAGVPEATFNLGAMLVSARGVKRDYVEGLAWLLVARQQGAEAEAGIEQVRKRLARRSQWIASAEARANALTAELRAAREGRGPLANLREPAAPAPTATRPNRIPVTVEPPAATPAAPPRVELEPAALQLPGDRR